MDELQEFFHILHKINCIKFQSLEHPYPAKSICPQKHTCIKRNTGVFDRNPGSSSIRALWATGVQWLLPRLHLQTTQRLRKAEPDFLSKISSRADICRHPSALPHYARLLKLVRSLTTSPAIISPTTGGTNALLRVPVGAVCRFSSSPAGRCSSCGS